MKGESIMAKKKKLFTFLTVTALAAGAYYYLQKKNSAVPENMDDDIDDFEDDVEDQAPSKSKRNYVNLDFNTVEQKVSEGISKVADVATKAADSIGAKLSQAESKVIEFFDDRKADVADAVEDAVEDAADVVDEVSEEITEAADAFKETV